MDPDCHGTGTCPWGPGVDPYALQTLAQYPLNNGFVTGDGLNTGSFNMVSAQSHGAEYIYRQDRLRFF